MASPTVASLISPRYLVQRSTRPDAYEPFSRRFGRNTFGHERRFAAADNALFKVGFVPGPAQYQVANSVGQPTFDSLHRTAPSVGFGKVPELNSTARKLALIKISKEDQDKPVAEALKNTLSRNAGRVVDLFREWDSDGNGMREPQLSGRTRITAALRVPSGAREVYTQVRAHP
eukprot:6541206-Prymnesium_polylepis.1